MLLQLRQNTGYMDEHWAAAAAGHVEQGETAYDAARREAAEEIGVTELDLAFVTAMQRTRHADAIDERVDFFFTARSWTGEPRIVEPPSAPTCGGARSTTCPTRWCRTSCWYCRLCGAGSSAVHDVRVRLGNGETNMAEDKLPTQDAEALGEMPEPQIEPREPNPGGADAMPQDEAVNRPTSTPRRTRRSPRRTRRPQGGRGHRDRGHQGRADGTPGEDNVHPEEESPA